MTDPLRKAAEMALERLESHEYWMDERAIEALREALAQPEWVTLTDEDIKALPEWFPSHATSAVLPLVRAVQAKLKEKNR